MLIQRGTTTCAFSPEIKCPGKQKVNAQSKAEKAKLRGRIQNHSSVQSPKSCPRDSAHHHHQGNTLSTPLLCASPEKIRSFILETAVPSALGWKWQWYFTHLILDTGTAWPLCPGCTASVPQQGQVSAACGSSHLGITFSHKPQGVNRQKISYC